MKWDDICAKLGMPTNLSFNTVPPDARVVSCYYVEEFLCAWWHDCESVYSLDDAISTEDERRLDEDFDY
jgi:hypothetical protein